MTSLCTGRTGSWPLLVLLVVVAGCQEAKPVATSGGGKSVTPTSRKGLGPGGSPTTRGGVPVQPAAVEIVSAEQLARAYKSDKAAADGRYKGKWVAIEGPLQDVRGHASDVVTVEVDGLPASGGEAAYPIDAKFAPDAGKKAFGVTHGQKVRIKGVCEGDLGGIAVRLTNCELSEVIGPDPAVSVRASELAGAYAVDAAAADGKYKGKQLVIDGVVQSVSDPSFEPATVVLGGEKDDTKVRIEAKFSGQYLRDQAAKLKKGDKVMLKAAWKSSGAGVVVADCYYVVP